MALNTAPQGYAFTGANALMLRAYTAPNLSSWPGSVTQLPVPQMPGQVALPGLPDPGAIAGNAGQAVVSAAGAGLADLWRRSGATISVLLVGVGLVAIALLRTETVQTAIAGSAKVAAL